jgi:hypothetical protein
MGYPLSSARQRWENGSDDSAANQPLASAPCCPVQEVILSTLLQQMKLRFSREKDLMKLLAWSQSTAVVVRVSRFAKQLIMAEEEQTQMAKRGRTLEGSQREW